MNKNLICTSSSRPDKYLKLMTDYICESDCYGLNECPDDIEYIIDIGAGIGIFANHSFKKFKNLKKIISIDPCKVMMNDLKTNVLCFENKIAVENLGFGNGELIYLSDYNKGNPDKNKFSKKKPDRILEVVKTCSLADIFEKYNIPKNSKYAIKVDSFGAEDFLIEFVNREYVKNSVFTSVKVNGPYREDTLLWMSSFKNHCVVPTSQDIYVLIDSMHAPTIKIKTEHNSTTRKMKKSDKKHEVVKNEPKIKNVEHELPYEAVYIINGIQRSGNHAISYWVSANLLPDDIKLNNVIPNTDKNLIRYNNNSNIKSAYKKNVGNAKYLILGLENQEKIIESIDVQKINAKKIYNITILRNPLNNFASLLKNKKILNQLSKNGVSGQDRFVNVWLEYLDMFLNLNIEGVECIGINFDEWNKNKDYRDILADKLGIENNDRSLDFVPLEGDGSSFDKRKFNGRAREMKVNERWYSYVNDERLIRIGILLHKEIEEMFGSCNLLLKGRNVLKTLSIIKNLKEVQEHKTQNEFIKDFREINKYIFKFIDETNGKLIYDMVDINGEHKFLVVIDITSDIINLEKMRKTNYLLFMDTLKELYKDKKVKIEK